MIFDGATGKLNLELETETREPSDQVLRRRDTPAEPPGRQPEEKDMCSGSMYQEKGDRKAPKAWADRPFRVAGWK